MSNVIRFPTTGRIPATAIPRERFEELAQLSLDLVDQIFRLLDAAEPDHEDQGHEPEDA